MRDAGGEHADALQALGAEKLLLDPFAGRDVGGDREAALRPALFVAQHGHAAGENQFLAFPVLKTDLAVPFVAGVRGASGGFYLGQRFRSEEIAVFAADRLGRRPAEEAFGALIPENHPIRAIRDDDHVTGFVENARLVANLALDLVAAEADRGNVHGDLGELSLAGIRRDGLLEIGGEGAEDPMMGVEDRRRPAGAESVLEGRFAITLPQRIGGDVGDDHLAAAVHCGAAGAGGGTHFDFTQQGPIALRQSGRSALAEGETVFLQEENGAEHLGALALDEPQQREQRVVQRFAAGEHFEDLVLAIDQGFVLLLPRHIAHDGREIVHRSLRAAMGHDDLGNGGDAAVAAKNEILPGPRALLGGGVHVLPENLRGARGRVEVLYVQLGEIEAGR